MKPLYKLIKAEKLEALKADFHKTLETNAAATSFIKEIENGNLNANFTSETNGKEELTMALLAMQKQLQKISEEEKERSWITQGLAMFAELLRSDNENSQAFYQNIISQLVKYLNVNQGGLFLVDEQEDASDVNIELVACYAYNRQKHLAKGIKPGEGLIGQCYLEKATIFMTDVPQSYVKITSGLGTAPPACLIIVPLKVNEQVHGIVELASFQPLKPYQVDFLERLGESIASSVSSVKISQRTKRLLTDTQNQSEEMRAQEEELRQNMEELGATQEEMARVSKEMEGQLDAINKTMATIEFDLRGNIITANANFLRLLEYRLEEIQGQHHRIFVEETERKSESYRQFWEQLSLGRNKIGEFKRYTKTGKEVYINGIYNPILDRNGKPVKVLKLAYDITTSKQMEFRIKAQLEEAQAQEEMMRQSMEELGATQEEMSRIFEEFNKQEQHFSELLNGACESIAAIDLNYQLINWNQAFVSAFKDSSKIEKGMDLFTIFPPEARAARKEILERVLAGETIEEINPLANQDLNKTIQLKHIPLRNKNNEIVGIGLFIQEIGLPSPEKKKV